MLKNLGKADRVTRMILAAILAITGFTGLVTGTTAAVMYTLAVVLAATSIVSFCPLYSLFGIRTTMQEKTS